MKSIFWFRRDLRLEDNIGLFHALKDSSQVVPIFIFDTNILSKLDNKEDARIGFIWSLLEKINSQLKTISRDSKVLIFKGRPEEIFTELVKKIKFDRLYCNADFEGYAIQRDKNIHELLEKESKEFKRFRDHIIFSPGEVVKENGEDYKVYTPFSKAWKKKLSPDRVKAYPSEESIQKIFVPEEDLDSIENMLISDLSEIGFLPSSIKVKDLVLTKELLSNYKNTRDLPYLLGTSSAGPHLRFGSVSTRSLLKTAFSISEQYVNELIWREFFIHHLYFHPKITTENFRYKFDKVPWRKSNKDFEKWCSGNTGIPIVDAGMRELTNSGYMHNRVRMICANFLTKHLLLPWQWGEAFFAKHLLDFELASNVGNWQWAAGTGCDAAPYFRIFNPDLQQEKFDPDFIYIKKWVPEFNTTNYVKPMVDLKEARNRALEAFNILKT